MKRRREQERDEAIAREQADARREALLAELKARQVGQEPEPPPAGPEPAPDADEPAPAVAEEAVAEEAVAEEAAAEPAADAPAADDEEP
jgi:hypothetical protein